MKGLLDFEKLIEFTPADHEGLEPGPARAGLDVQPDRRSGPDRPDLPRLRAGPRAPAVWDAAARLTTGITGTLYTSEQNEESPEAEPALPDVLGLGPGRGAPGGGRRDRNALSVYQKSLLPPLRGAETGGMTLREVIEDGPSAQLDALGADDFTALFIAKEQTWRRRYQDSFGTGPR